MALRGELCYSAPDWIRRFLHYFLLNIEWRGVTSNHKLLYQFTKD